MPVTRSATRQSSSAANGRRLAKSKTANSSDASKETTTPKGRKAKGGSSRVNKKSQGKEDSVKNHIPAVQTAPAVPDDEANGPEFLPAVLSFSFDEAKQHIIAADPRFEDLFTKLKCRPFEHLEHVDPFRTLTTSILGQQISWLAARSITHRFIRLFDPSLPEKPSESGWSSNPNSFFPSAGQVVSQDIATLRTAGLSGRKAEYVQDLAARFADGRLSNEKIIHANDEELYEILTAVRGIGRWTVDMFAIFSLRRPDILPVGDLGVQRGIVRWFLSLHSPKHHYAIAPRKLPSLQRDANESQTDNGEASQDSTVVTLPEMEQPVRSVTPDAGPFPPAPIPTTPSTPAKGRKRDNANAEDPEVPMPPPAFTPSINRTLNKVLPTKYHPAPLPDGLSVKELQNRLEGKKKVKGVILSPKEMEELTESWKPYRSLGVYYMWALAEGDKSDRGRQILSEAVSSNASRPPST